MLSSFAIWVKSIQLSDCINLTWLSMFQWIKTSLFYEYSSFQLFVKLINHVWLIRGIKTICGIKVTKGINLDLPHDCRIIKENEISRTFISKGRSLCNIVFSIRRFRNGITILVSLSRKSLFRRNTKPKILEKLFW